MIPKREISGSTGIRLLTAVFGCCVLLCGGCATVPETGRLQLVLTNPEADAREAALAFDQLKKRSKLSTNSSYKERVTRVGARIVKVAPVPKERWEFVVFEDPEPNAFVMPGGKVGVNSGLFRIATDDAMLATVLAHEVGHVVARHGSERKSHGILTSLAGVALDVGLGVGTDLPVGARSAILGAYGAGASVGVILPYSRAHEYEADRLGLIYMARAGYDPEAAIRFWKGMQRYGEQRKGFSPPAFLSTHPVDAARIARLEELLPAAREEYFAARRGN